MANPTFKVFLSHRYKSPLINQRLFEVLTAHANIQFEVDVGTKATNVTRLERFVRDCDAFVGIYPFPSEDETRPDLKTALLASRYFRLELDLAARSRRPAIVFVDKRYGTAVTVPKTLHECRYDHREMQAASSDSREQGFREAAKRFCAEVAASIQLSGVREQLRERDRVGLLLPDNRLSPTGYSKRQIVQMEERLTGMALDPVRLNWRGAVDGPFLSQLENLDWAIVDIGADACSGGLPAFLHGYFVPQMRLLRMRENASDAPSPLETTLLAAFEVGYPKDIIRWENGKNLNLEFDQRLATLYEPRKHIATSDQARAYFASAALRKEAVFLSYSGEDLNFASGLVRVLKERFQQVFNYRDQAESIVPGRPWMEEVFDKLSTSALGVPLLSSSYFKSGNCTHEAREMMSLADSGALRMIPVKVNEEPLDLPSWIRGVQYIRGWEYPTHKELVEKLVSAYDAARPKSAVEPKS